MHSRRDFPELLNSLNLHGRAAEVGTRDGDYIRRILPHWECERIYLIDAWQPMGDYRDVSDAPADVQRARLHRLIDTVAPWWDRIRIIQEDSVAAARLIPDASLDWVFIDANHAYSHVRADIGAWLPKVRPGGVLSGHDYLDGVIEIGGVPTEFGVRRAVDEVWGAGSVRVTTEVSDDDYPTWWIRIM